MSSDAKILPAPAGITATATTDPRRWAALCGAAQGAGMLIASRVAQGAMGALMIPQVLSVIQVTFPAAERIKALAAFGITAGLDWAR
jgi:MFS family permease